MKQINTYEAMIIYASGKWMKLSPLQLAGFQLYQNIIFCDFNKFHDALNDSLHRGENFGNEGIRFRIENVEKLQKDWEKLYPIPDFSELERLLLY